MLCRDRAHKIGETGYIWETVSYDGGLHWQAFKPTNLPNPDSGFDTVDLGEGKVILIYNHSHTDRFPLNLAFSLDGGDTWSQPLVLDAVGEFPAAILTSDGRVHVTYAIPSSKSEQRRIKHIVIEPKSLTLFSRSTF
jgi:predicted neuraminidase